MSRFYFDLLLLQTLSGHTHHIQLSTAHRRKFGIHRIQLVYYYIAHYQLCVPFVVSGYYVPG